MSERKKVRIKDNRFGLSDQMWDDLGDEKNKRKLYNIYTIIQDNEKERQIEAPCDELKQAQRKILDTLIYPCSGPSKFAHGFVRNRSAHTAADRHMDKDILIRIDVKDFFPSIKEAMIRDGLDRWSHSPLKDDLADTVIRVCCLEGRLPQGAPTSPALSNIVCRAMDYHMDCAGRHLMASFTRYADDMIFSARYECIGPIREQPVAGEDPEPAWKCPHYMRKLTRPDERGMCPGCRMAGPSLNQDIPWLISEIEKFGFEVNPEKTRIIRRGKRQRANGLVVNYQKNIPETTGPRVNVDYYLETRAMAKNMLLKEAFGDSLKNKGRVVTGNIQSLIGRIAHVKSTSPQRAPYLNSMVEKIQILRDSSKKNEKRRKALLEELTLKHAT